MVMRLYVDFNTMTTDPKERVYINTQLQPALAQDGCSPLSWFGAARSPRRGATVESDGVPPLCFVPRRLRRFSVAL